MLKYEAAQKIFSLFLHHSYDPVEIDLLEGWKLTATATAPKVDAGNPYLGSIPISLQFDQGTENPISHPLHLQCIRNKLHPNLEDEQGGYAILIKSKASELLFRSMQAAKYEEVDAHMKVKITTDLTSKKGDASFRQKMQACIQQFEPQFKQWGGEQAGDTQFTYATYLSESDTFVQDQQNILKMMLLLAVFKAVLKGELDLPLSALMPPVGPDSKPSLADNFHHYLLSKQFSYSLDFVRRFVTSLQTKPFVILSGSSGTGKTKIAQYFAAYMRSPSDKGTVHDLIGELNGSNMSDSGTFHFQLNSYTFDYHRIIVTVEMLEWVNLDLDNGVEIEVRFDGQAEQSLMKRQGPTVRLGFRKTFMAWLKQNCAIGDHLKLTIQDEGRVFLFEQESSASFTQHDDNLAFVSVRPDWLDQRGLLGYYNPLTEKYDPTPLLKLMLRADGDRERPYFVILDEMNLAKVEYYFSDFLSCMESRRLDPVSGQLEQEPLVLHQLARPVEHVDDHNRVYQIPAQLPIPPNVYFIGTVNIDETTYMFSPKVLDRANVIECSRIDLSAYWESHHAAASVKDCEPLSARVTLFTNEGQYHMPLYSKEFLQERNRTQLDDAFQVVLKLHQVLEREGVAFGYRVLDEVMTYLLLSLRENEDMLREALDAQIVQKVLPKLHGNRKQLEQLLLRLLEQFANGSISGDPLSANNRSMLEAEDSYLYPLSGLKVYSMYKQLMQTGYCSFVC